MKKLIIIPFLLLSVLVFSQVIDDFNIVTLKLNADGSVTTDPTNLTDLKLPIKFIFTSDFQGKSIKITSTDNIPLAPKVVKFGDENLQKDGGDNTFRIEIRKDRTVNPGDNDKINLDKFVIQVEQFKIDLSLSSLGTDGGGTTEPKNDEEYEVGYIYYDVMKLLDKNSDKRIKMKILGSYEVDVNTVKNNPYLDEVFSGLFSENLGQGVFGGLVGNLGNTDVTSQASGLARLLAERAREELNEAFFNKMKNQLNAYPELKTAFPKTVSYLDKIETFAYASILNALKDAFEMDMQNLPENLYRIKSLTVGDCDKIAICGNKEDCDPFDKCEERLNKLTEFFISKEGHWVALGMFSVKEGIQSTNPADLLKSITESTEFIGLKGISPIQYDDLNILSSIELSYLISQSLISRDENQVWVTTSELNSLFNTNNGFKIYLGLLVAKELKGDVNIKFYDKSDKPVSFGTYLKDNFTAYDQFESLIKNTYSAFNVTNNAAKKMIAASEKSVEADPQAIYNYCRTLTSSLKPIAHNPLLIRLVGKDIGASYDQVEKFLVPSIDIVYHITTKKYSAAIYDASILLSELNELKTKDEKGNEIKYVGFRTVTKSFEKYGTLISTVANAQSSEEVKKALDASILPVGSSAIKRKSAWSFSINGYVGLFYGQARSTTIDTLRNFSTMKLDTIFNSNKYRTFGVFAPIGLSFNRGLQNGWGFTLGAQILDLGALVNFYLEEGDEASLPTDFEVKLSDILSPGLQLGINLPKMPVTIMGGIQYVPALNNIAQISSSQLSPIAWRAQIGVVVDIPLFNLKVWDFKN